MATASSATATPAAAIPAAVGPTGGNSENEIKDFVCAISPFPATDVFTVMKRMKSTATEFNKKVGARGAITTTEKVYDIPTAVNESDVEGSEHLQILYS